ncbi:MAG TPA: type I-C CRISPR-associated protein Cas8c/Csd1, partial [Armatimonadetes bacterium]|nr:type I-C CRISPR-associated protein Cas8c/Csd1 [Armatimonadota bacterium]
PATVFPMLIKLNHAHLSKLAKDKPGAATNRKKDIGEIVEGIDDYSKHLSLEEQGLFSLGYYHQRQATFSKSESQETEQGALK